MLGRMSSTLYRTLKELISWWQTWIAIAVIMVVVVSCSSDNDSSYYEYVPGTEPEPMADIGKVSSHLGDDWIAIRGDQSVVGTWYTSHVIQHKGTSLCYLVMVRLDQFTTTEVACELYE